MYLYPCQRGLNSTAARAAATSQITDRRQFLSKWGMGVGGLAATCMMGQPAFADDESNLKVAASGGILERLHHPGKAKSIIYLYMDGGPAQMDTFDHKPTLKEWNGKPFPAKREPTQFDNIGKTLASPWEFNQYGESGLWVSDLFPNVAKHADKLCMIHSMTNQFSEHTNANYFLHTGLGLVGRPSMGAWCVYGLGNESENLPGFVVINGGLTPPGGLDNFASGFLPAAFQASVFSPTGEAVANLGNPSAQDAARLGAKRDLLSQLDAGFLAATGNADAVDSAIKNYELAYRMQESVPEVSNLNEETKEIRDLYGVEHENKGTATFARECLLARRLVERGVRFVELTCPGVGHDRWDQHGNLTKGHSDNAMAVDQPIAALLQDLEQRGMLDETLVVWSGEFGRTPFAQGSNGRDHNPYTFTLWMAGGGVKGGTTYGESDEFSYRALVNPVEVHDLHATMLHLMGIDHERLTFRFGGRDHRLTDVHGHVLHDIIA